MNPLANSLANPLAITYVYWLVAASVGTSVVASYAAFSFAERVASSTGTRSALWLGGGACSMGLGIWSMHYLGMLAVQLPVEVTYHVPTVLLSLLLAVLASAGTLKLVSQKRLGLWHIGLGGVFMGAAIGGMHYVGMAAMRSSAMHHYSLPMVGLSVVVAVGFSWMALWIAFSASKEYQFGSYRRLGGAVLMGSGIAAMHYTAMAAVTFWPGHMAESTAATVKMSSLGIIAIALTTALVLAGTMIAALYDRRRFQELACAHAELAQAQAALLAQQSALEEKNSQLQVLAIHDGMTGIHNRRYFDETISAELRRAARTRTPVSLLMVDVDHFKKLNDRYGHPVGDQCLRQIAQELQRNVRRVEDMIARYGGEEFAVLLPGTTEAGALVLAEVLRGSIEKLKIRNEDSPDGAYATVSIGIDTRTPGIGESPSEILRAADEALYLAKSHGRNQVQTTGIPLAGLVG